MRFWENHAKEMRRARLLQASAVIYAEYFSKNVYYPVQVAVDKALELEAELDKQLSAKNEATQSGSGVSARRVE